MNLWGKSLFFLLLPLFFIGTELDYSASPELCDNALDDDNDGKIDLNDDDCNCPVLEPESLIPNPSFEDQACCPEGHSSVHCAASWLQASYATPDYYHSCIDWKIGLEVPQPLPDGNGYIGIIDDIFNGNFNPNWKEYVGTCLIDTLQVDSVYRFQFYAGFMSREASPETSIAIFGTTDCANLPFGGDDGHFGCPSNATEWIRLGAVGVQGEKEWKQYEFKFKSKLQISGVVIGPDCSHLSLNRNPYHFLDNLVLAKDIDFEVDIKANNQACAADLAFEIPHRDGFTYQWYKNGIAIIGETTAKLEQPNGKGEYQIRVENEKGCKISEPYSHNPPSKFIQATQTICRGTSYLFGNQEITTEGNYLDTLKTINNCDSIIRLEVKLEDSVQVQFSAKIFREEIYNIGGDRLNKPGKYIKTIPSYNGCDSTIFLNLEYYSIFIPNAFSPNDDGINDIFAVYGGEDLRLVSNLEIYNRWGNLMYQGIDLRSGEGWNGNTNRMPAPNAVYVYKATLMMEEEKEKSLQGMFTLIR